MYCLKCGQETENERVFCAHCLEIMDQYPVKTDTPLQLPKRSVSAAPKKMNRRRELAPEEQIRRLRITVRWLAVSLLAALTVAGVLGWMQFFRQEQPQKPEQSQIPIGQNYTVDSTDDN